MLQFIYCLVGKGIGYLLFLAWDELDKFCKYWNWSTETEIARYLVVFYKRFQRLQTILSNIRLRHERMGLGWESSSDTNCCIVCRRYKWRYVLILQLILWFTQGFSSGLYPFYRDENGNPRTPRDEFGRPPRDASG